MVIKEALLRKPFDTLIEFWDYSTIHVDTLIDFWDSSTIHDIRHERRCLLNLASALSQALAAASGTCTKRKIQWWKMEFETDSHSQLKSAHTGIFPTAST